MKDGVYVTLRLMRIMKPGVDLGTVIKRLEEARADGSLESLMEEIPEGKTYVRVRGKYFLWVGLDVYGAVLELFGDSVAPMYLTKQQEI